MARPGMAGRWFPVPPIGIITAGRMAATQGISGPAGIELG